MQLVQVGLNGGPGKFHIAGEVVDVSERTGTATGIEVKSAAGGLPDSITGTTSAFANLPGGGLIAVGLDEAMGLRPFRLKDAVGTAAGVACRARQAFEPAIHIEVEVMDS